MATLAGSMKMYGDSHRGLLILRNNQRLMTDTGTTPPPESEQRLQKFFAALKLDHFVFGEDGVQNRDWCELDPWELDYYLGLAKSVPGAYIPLLRNPAYDTDDAGGALESPRVIQSGALVEFVAASWKIGKDDQIILHVEWTSLARRPENQFTLEEAYQLFVRA